MMRRLFSLVFLLASLTTSSQLGAESREALVPFGPETEGRLFTVEGSNTVGAGLMKNFLLDYFRAKGVQDVQAVELDVANEYRVQGYVGRRAVYVDVAAHGSSTGFRGLFAGSADIGMSSRRIKMSEVEQLQALGNLRDYSNEHIVAIDGLAVIVNPANPVSSLTVDQIAKIFSGEIANWREVGGENRAISLYARDDNSGTWDTFNSLVLGEDYRLSTKALRFESNDELSDLVADDAQGVGFVGLASVRRAKSLAVADTGTHPLRPEVLVVATEDYVLSRRLYLYSSERKRNRFVRDFVDYVQGDRGQKQVERTGFVSQNLISVPQLPDQGGPAPYRAGLKEAERLSVNLRFAEGSAELDNKARRDILRIVQYMQRPENADKRMILVGFGDRKQTEQRALVLSKLRAMAVKSELFSRGIMSDPVIGLGADLPVANNVDAGRSKNRRVEVWVRRDSEAHALSLTQHD